jgi:hypothetical protein
MALLIEVIAGEVLRAIGILLYGSFGIAEALGHLIEIAVRFGQRLSRFLSWLWTHLLPNSHLLAALGY